jgi:uncharacterized membrane protein YphA (DoxX/SURF4 family)
LKVACVSCIQAIMSVGQALATRWALRTIGIAVLLVALAVALPMEGSQPFHSHEAGTTGIYNGDCPLAALAAFHGIGLPATTPATAWVLLVAGAATLASGARLFAPVARHTDSRAPPLV